MPARRWLLLLLFQVLGASSIAGCALPPRSLDRPMGAPGASFDAAGWDSLLSAHVVDGQVDYPGLARSGALPALREQIAAVDLGGASRGERLAFLINAYNVLAVAGILDGGSPASLLGRARFFLWTRYPVAGERITLWDLEHERIRPLDEPRIHFALVCASASCPRLASQAFTAADLDEQLERETRRFVGDASRNRFDVGAGVAQLSAIFDWYEEDFTSPGRSVLQYLAPYVDDPALRTRLEDDDLEVEHLPYDWSLNGTPPGR